MIINLRHIFFFLEIKATPKNDLIIVATCYINAEKLIYNPAIKWQTITTIFITLYSPNKFIM
jgi:hypothetical protein